MDNPFADLKYSLRSIRKSWRFSLGVVLTLALGIGANTLGLFDRRQCGAQAASVSRA